MSSRADKLVIDAHTHTLTDAGYENTQKPKLASGKKYSKQVSKSLYGQAHTARGSDTNWHYQASSDSDNTW